jgi:hypothetical protein
MIWFFIWVKVVNIFFVVVVDIPNKTDTLEIIQMETLMGGHYDGNNEPIKSNIVVWSTAGEVCYSIDISDLC